MLVRTAPSAPAAAGLARRGHSFVLARRPAGRRFWSSAPMDLAVKATGLDQGLPAAHPSRLDPRFVGCCLSLWPVSTLVQWFPEWGRSACRDALAADSRVSCPLAGPWLVSFGARLLSWWLKLSCLDVLGWPWLVLPFDHGVGTPVSSPQSRLSDALRLSLVSAAQRPSASPTAHRCRRTVSAIRCPSTVPGDASWCAHVLCPRILLPVPFGCLPSVLRLSPEILPGCRLEALGVASCCDLAPVRALWRDSTLHCPSTTGSAHRCRRPSLGYPTPFDYAWSRFFRSFVVARSSPCQVTVVVL
jgi:hypothetical protein